jgi:hypothetical protein
MRGERCVASQKETPSLVLGTRRPAPRGGRDLVEGRRHPDLRRGTEAVGHAEDLSGIRHVPEKSARLQGAEPSGGGDLVRGRGAGVLACGGRVCGGEGRAVGRLLFSMELEREGDGSKHFFTYFYLAVADHVI